MREDKILGLLKNKNRKINPQITLDIISQISKLSLYYNNGIKYIENYIKNIINQCILYYNMFKGYIMDSQLKYF